MEGYYIINKCSGQQRWIDKEQNTKKNKNSAGSTHKRRQPSLSLIKCTLIASSLDRNMISILLLLLFSIGSWFELISRLTVVLVTLILLWDNSLPYWFASSTEVGQGLCIDIDSITWIAFFYFKTYWNNQWLFQRSKNGKNIIIAGTWMYFTFVKFTLVSKKELWDSFLWIDSSSDKCRSNCRVNLFLKQI